MRSPTYRSLANVLLLMASLLVGAGLCEVALRIYYVVDRPAQIADLSERRALPPRRVRLGLGDVIQLSANPKRIFELRPSLRVIFPNVWMQTNSQGWRDVEFTTDKPAGTVRLLGIGDSVMFGWSVDVGERYTDRLARLLAERYPAVGWQTYTLACPGYNLAMEVAALEDEGVSYAPDMILYGYVSNDSCLPNFVGSERDVWGSQSFLRDFLKNLDLPAPALVPRDGVVGDVTERRKFSTRYCTPSNVARPYRHLVGGEAFDRAFGRLLAIGESLDAQVMVVSHSLEDGIGLPAVFRDALVVHGIAPPGQPGGGALPPKWWVGPRDPHPNAEAHQLIAENILQRGEAVALWQRLVDRAIAGSTR